MVSAICHCVCLVTDTFWLMVLIWIPTDFSSFFKKKIHKVSCVRCDPGFDNHVIMSTTSTFSPYSVIQLSASSIFTDCML